jgi:hypothetical protein
MPGIVDLHSIEIIDIYPQVLDGTSTWPCPGCGERRHLAKSVTALVRNKTGPLLERAIRLCDVCVDSVVGAEAAPSAEPEQPLSEPWLDDLALVTAVRRAMSRLEAQDSAPGAA